MISHKKTFSYFVDFPLQNFIFLGEFPSFSPDLSHDFPHHFPHCPMICQQNSLSARTSSSPPHGLHHEPVGRLQTPESRAIAQAAHAEAHIGEDLAQWRGVWFFPETKLWEIRRISMEIHRKILVKWMFLVVPGEMV